MAYENRNSNYIGYLKNIRNIIVIPYLIIIASMWMATLDKTYHFELRHLVKLPVACGNFMIDLFSGLDAPIAIMVGIFLMAGTFSVGWILLECKYQE